MSNKDPDEKRTRSDTVEGAMDYMADAMLPPLQPPAHIKLRPQDVPFWNDIVRARARSLWNNSDLAPAANLARCRADIERLQQEIDKAGDIIENKKGTEVVNPRHTLLEVLSRRSISLMTKLHLHAGATIGDKRDAAAALEAENAMRDAAETTLDEDDDLLASPNAVH